MGVIGLGPIAIRELRLCPSELKAVFAAHHCGFTAVGVSTVGFHFYKLLFHLLFSSVCRGFVVGKPDL